MRDNNVRTVVCTRVIDGDTFEGTMFLLASEIQFHNQRFRLWGVDTPERGEAGYHEATKFVEGVIGEKVVYCTIYGKDAFGRWLATVHTETSETSLNDALLKRSLAVPFEK